MTIVLYGGSDSIHYVMHAYLFLFTGAGMYI